MKLWKTGCNKLKKSRDKNMCWQPKCKITNRSGPQTSRGSESLKFTIWWFMVYGNRTITLYGNTIKAPLKRDINWHDIRAFFITSWQRALCHDLVFRPTFKLISCSQGAYSLINLYLIELMGKWSSSSFGRDMISIGYKKKQEIKEGKLKWTEIESRLVPRPVCIILKSLSSQGDYWR